ncbi:MAG: hypothetical protein ABIJ59_16550 [Pseudomonadota bacterium]
MEFLTTKWFITAILFFILYVIIEFLQFYYKIHKKLPFFDRKLKEQRPPPTIRKTPDQNDLKNYKENDNT